MNSADTIQEIGALLASASRILVVSHIRPDYDAIGSVMGLTLALRESGKEVYPVLSDGVPSNLMFIPGSNQIEKKASYPVDLIVVLDCSDTLRIGDALNGQKPNINIDHHKTNLQFATLNLVEPDEVATAAILAKYLPDWGLAISPAVASALLVGIIGDTIGFRTSNMTSQALRLSANLMEQGANLPVLYQRTLNTRSFEAASYWGYGLGRLEREGRLVWTSLTLEDRKNSGYSGNDDADLINILTTIKDCDVAVIFVEQKNGKVKVSWRSEPGYDVSTIAVKFGGGGHAAASGAEITGSLEEVKSMVIQVTQELFYLPE